MAAFDVLDVSATRSGQPRSLAIPALIAGAWAILVIADATGTAAALHHHALIEGGHPFAIAVPLFLAGWLVMVAAMMLPASLPAVRVVEAVTTWPAGAPRARVAFLAAFAAVWTAFGLLAFVGDVGLHHLVDATPWLAARPWLIEAAVLAVAGGYQLIPLKRRSLAACRHPAEAAARASLALGGAGRIGLRHGLDCLGSSWALMLLMFAEGFANLAWMAALTAVMAYETTGRSGGRAASAIGIVLVLASIATLTGGAAPRP